MYSSTIRLAAVAAGLIILAAPLTGSATQAPLTLPAAEQAALQQQPLLAAQQARIAASRERQVLAGELPDPQLIFGISELPLNTDERFSLQRDGDTDVMVGVSQEFPRAEKRRLRSEQERIDSEQQLAELVMLEAQLRRDTALAWLDIWTPQQALGLVDALINEAQLELEAADIAYRAGGLDQERLLAARVELELLQDRRGQLEQTVASAEPVLRRWTGAPPSTDLTLPDSEPTLPTPPPLTALRSRVPKHPELVAAHFNIQGAENRLALAEQAYKPDWRLDVRYGYRPGPGFSEMLSVMVGMDLPVFTRNRQDRGVGAAVAELETVRGTHDDHHRMLLARAEAQLAAYRHAEQRLMRYDQSILPAAASRVDAALAGYRAGTTELAALLQARRSLLDIRLMRLDLLAQRLRSQAEIRYLTTAEPPVGGHFHE